MNYLKRFSSDWVLTVCLLITMATVIFTGIQTQRVGEQNQRFLSNFSDYMRCLVVSDPEVVKTLGKEAYFNECNRLLFRGTGIQPGEPVTVTVPTTTTIGAN